MNDLDSIKVGVIGLGYVGLPLAVEFGKHFPTIGFDIDPARISELDSNRDRTGEMGEAELAARGELTFTADPAALAGANFYIVTVPTPISSAKDPDLASVLAASETIGHLLSPGDVVVYESTVYPGVTEDICAPVLERLSGLALNSDFFIGYSPERINPGDRKHRFSDITKVTSGSTPEAADLIDRVYARVVTAGTFRAASIKVAEAAKVIENTQRDVNIALVNEFTELFHRLGLSYTEVLAAARTKWNFLPFEPGLVGGHCIGVDPYYLSHKARQVSFHPQLIDAARRINDRMPRYVAQRIVRELALRKKASQGARVLVLGLTFKEDCPDLRNTKVVDLIDELRLMGAEVDAYDPVADAADAKREHKIEYADAWAETRYDVVILAVRHRVFREQGAEAFTGLLADGGVFVDLKNTFPELPDALRL